MFADVSASDEQKADMSGEGKQSIVRRSLIQLYNDRFW